MSTHDEWKISVRSHSGSTQDEIDNEPDWRGGMHEHYVGYKNTQGRRPGLVGSDDDYASIEEAQMAQQKLEHTKQAEREGHLVSFQQAIRSEKDLHIDHPEHRSLGWRFRLDFTEDEIKSQQWPVNLRRHAAEQKRNDAETDHQNGEQSDHGKTGKEKDRSNSGEQTKTQNGSAGDAGDSRQGAKLSSQDSALLAALKEEQSSMANLKNDDGKGRSSVENRTSNTIDEADQFTPDNWIPRSKELIRLTGKHPVNAEAPLDRLYGSGFITPNELHYVRSHGAVPKLLWELHRLKITWPGGSAVLSMKELQDDFDNINLPILIACDNNRRKELNLIKRTTGFNWGPGGIGCAYWKGPLLRDVLLRVGVPEALHTKRERGQRWFIHFRGADNPNNVHYETSVSLGYIMDDSNDVLLAHQMNDVPLPPDHGYPLRVVIPGYVGGRQVKWLEEIWINDKENDSFYHLHDNRILPSFITESDSELAKFFFRHPDTAAYEQALQSIIAIPAHGDKLDLRNGDMMYRVKGFAYNGRGDQVQRVEVSLDGETWRYCIRSYPEAPMRHGQKFWTWCFWHLDVAVSELARATAITVRALDVKKMTQPEKPVWNISGTMNNSQYSVKPEFAVDEETGPHLLFRHPVEPADGSGGWMRNSIENQLKDAERKTDTPKKQFTREEVEKHDSARDCWLVIDNCVYDATSVLRWHPGGAAAILAHAGAVHRQTTTEFSSVHDEYAYAKLNECVLGSLTDKAKKYVAQMAGAASQQTDDTPSDQAIQKHRWVPVRLVARDSISEDTSTYRFKLPEGKNYLGIQTCQHIELGFHMRDRMLTRPYTPTKPIFPRGVQASDRKLGDGTGYFELVVKTYFPGDGPGGALSSMLREVAIGSEVGIRGPTGDIAYQGQGNFQIYGEIKTFKRVSLVVGGTGLTPAYSFVARSCLSAEDVDIRVVDANKAQDDILLHKELINLEKMSKGRLVVTHVLSDADPGWKGLTGRVDAAILMKHLFAPSRDSLVLLCGPPPMIEKAVIPALQDWGYVQDENMFGL